MGPNNYFYFFSTVAQSLAALMAFLGVFVVFKLQALEYYLKDLHKELDEETTHKFNIGFYGGIKLEQHVNDILSIHKDDPRKKVEVGEIKQLLNLYRDSKFSKQKIIKAFWGPIILMMLSLCVCFMGICFVSTNGFKSTLVRWAFIATWVLIPCVMIWNIVFMKNALETKIK